MMSFLWARIRPDRGPEREEMWTHRESPQGCVRGGRTTQGRLSAGPGERRLVHWGFVSREKKQRFPRRPAH